MRKDPSEGRGPDGDPKAAADRPMSYTPGPTEDNETASAHANRLDQTDTTSLRPERAQLQGEQRSARESSEKEGDSRSASPSGTDSGTTQAPFDRSADPMR